MKFMCVECDQAMQFESASGPKQGSVGIHFECPTCRRRMVMLTNPAETQLVRSLGLKLGGRPVPPDPPEAVRPSPATPSDGVLWADEAEARLERIPSMARPMARAAIAQYARERGAERVTPELMDEYRARTGGGFGR